MTELEGFNWMACWVSLSIGVVIGMALASFMAMSNGTE